MNGRVDLHSHTTASDGTLSPRELVLAAVRQGVTVLAVTDHDSTDGLAEAMEEAAKHPPLTIVPGLEINCDVEGAEIHVLGYFVTYAADWFQDFLREQRAERVARVHRIAERLGELGMPIEPAEVFALVGEELVQVTDNGTCNQRPSVSPDGEWVAYERFDSDIGQSRIHLVRIDGIEDHALAAAPLGAMWPTWSPGSDAIAYESASRIFRVEAFLEAAEPIQLTDIQSGQPNWSDDGDGGAWIAFYGYPADTGPLGDGGDGRVAALLLMERNSGLDNALASLLFRLRAALLGVPSDHNQHPL